MTSASAQLARHAPPSPPRPIQQPHCLTYLAILLTKTLIDCVTGARALLAMRGSIAVISSVALWAAHCEVFASMVPVFAMKGFLGMGEDLDNFPCPISHFRSPVEHFAA